jgi:hypothetical protein
MPDPEEVEDKYIKLLSAKYQPGDLNPDLTSSGKFDYPSDSFTDHDSAWNHVKHVVRMHFQSDTMQGVNKFRAVVLTITSDEGELPEIDENGFLKTQPVAAFSFRARIPELHSCLPDPCSSIPAIGKDGDNPGENKKLTSAQIEVIKKAIAVHPLFRAKTFGSTGLTTLRKPNVGDIVEVEFEKGPQGGRLIGGTYIRMVRNSSFVDYSGFCGSDQDLSDLFDEEEGSTVPQERTVNGKVEPPEIDWDTLRLMGFDNNDEKPAADQKTNAPVVTAVWAHPGNYTAKASPLKINRVVIHTSQGVKTGGHSYKVGNVFAQEGRNGSAHYAVDNYGNVTQMVMENDKAWHAGCSLNDDSIGIEITGRAEWSRDQWLDKANGFHKALETCARLTAAICAKHNINPTKQGLKINGPHTGTGADDVVTGHVAGVSNSREKAQTHWDPGCPTREGGALHETGNTGILLDVDEPSKCDYVKQEGVDQFDTKKQFTGGFPWDKFLKQVRKFYKDYKSGS